MADHNQTLARGTMMMFFSMSTAGVLSVLTSLLIARWLGVAQFGLYSLVVSLQGVVGIIAGLSIGMALAKFISEHRREREGLAQSFAKTGLVLVILLATAVGLLYVALAGPIGTGLYGEPSMKELIPFSALVVFSASIYATIVGIVQGCQRIRLLAIMQISYPSVNIGIVLLFLILIGIKGIFIGYFISQSAIAIAAFLVLQKGDFKFSSAPAELRMRSPTFVKLISFALPAVLGAVMVVPVIWAGNTELTLKTGLQEMGYFGAAYVIYQSLIVIPTALSLPMMPKVSELSANNSGQIEDLVARMMRFLSVVLFPLCFAIALFGRYVISLIYGHGFLEASKVLYLMVAASYFYALSSVVGTMLAGTGRMWLGLGLNAVWASVFLMFAFGGTPAWGAEGLGLSYVASYSVLLVFMMAVMRNVIRVKFNRLYVPVCLAAIFFGSGYLVIQFVTANLVALLGLLVLGFSVFVVIGRKEYSEALNRIRPGDA